jgi:toxin ParE1/3/4
MSYLVVYDPAAQQEYEEAVEWYARRSELASTHFIQEVKERIATIRNDPARFRKMYKNFQEALLHKYPCLIIYFVDEPHKTIVITSVFNYRRHPKRKYRKKQK